MDYRGGVDDQDAAVRSSTSVQGIISVGNFMGADTSSSGIKYTKWGDCRPSVIAGSRNATGLMGLVELQGRLLDTYRGDGVELYFW